MIYVNSKGKQQQLQQEYPNPIFPPNRVSVLVDTQHIKKSKSHTGNSNSDYPWIKKITPAFSFFPFCCMSIFNVPTTAFCNVALDHSTHPSPAQDIKKPTFSIVSTHKKNFHPAGNNTYLDKFEIVETPLKVCMH